MEGEAKRKISKADTAKQNAIAGASRKNLLI
jgi:hypothetical protein